MGILDNLKTVLNHNKKPIAEPKSISSSEFYNPSITVPKNIYEEPTYSSIAHNITSKQTYALSYLLDMAYVARTADNSFYLPKPYKIAHTGKSAKIFEEKYNSDVVFTNEYFKKNIKSSKKLDFYVDPRKELYGLIRTVYPEFCHNMDGKISPEDYEFYKKNKMSLKKCLSCHDTYSNTSLSKDILLNYQDNLAKLIDTLDFSKACKIEDTFVVSEINIFLDEFSKLSQEEKEEFAKHKIKLPSNSKNKKSIRALDFIQEIFNERIHRIDQYSSIEELYTKLSSKKQINLVVNDTQEEIDNKKGNFTPDDNIR